MPVGGKLVLKGNVPVKSGGVKKKKKKSQEDKQGSDAAASAADAETSKILNGYELPAKDETEDRRTEAEKRYDARIQKLELEQTKKLAQKSHRERVKDFNEHLSKLTEHYDIPKVGPG